jgi:arsenate reductase
MIAQAPDAPTIVFVCEHGTAKSVLAMAWFERLSRERNLPYRAVSRGTAPDSAFPRLMRNALRRDGIDIGRFVPTRFTGSETSVLVVSFDQPVVAALVAGRVPTIAWDNLPSVSASYPVARDSIRSRVAALVDSLARTRPNDNDTARRTRKKRG